MRKIFLTFTIMVLACIATNAQSTSPQALAKSSPTATTKGQVGQPQSALAGRINVQSEKQTLHTNTDSVTPPQQALQSKSNVAPAAKRKNKAMGAKKD